MIEDSISTKATAKSLLSFETPYFLELYKDEFIVAKKILNSDFDITAQPNIRVDSTNIFLNNCIVHEKIPIDIILYNDGKLPLKIEKIHLSCSCLERIENTQNIIINPQECYMAKFYFTPENLGDISRDIYISSNAINKPILHINISANGINNINN